MSENPKQNGDKPKQRDEKGQFIEGNSGGGRPKGSLSITEKIKKELEKCPEGEDKRTYLDLLVKEILDKAVKEGDQVMIKSIWNYIDGMPRQNIGLDGGEDGKPIEAEIKIKAEKSIKEFLNEDTENTTWNR